MTGEIWDTSTLEQHLTQVGERLFDDLHDRIIAQGKAIVPALLDVLNNERLQMGDAPGEGWAPIHAVDLLREMKATEAIQPMVMWMQKIDSLCHLHDRLLQALISFGEEALQPVLAAYDETIEPEERQSLCSILSESPVKNDTIYDILLHQLEEDVEWGTICLAEYGDSRALPHLEQALDEYEVTTDANHLLADQSVIEFCAAIQKMGGKLTPSQQHKLDQVKASGEVFRRRFDALLSRKNTRENTTRPREKPGRNDPCWCGSGKKYKKCHLDADRAASN
jgi:hypothetical protein